MGSARYTNILLTIIAVCLVYQCVKFGAPPSIAQTAYPNQAVAAAANQKPVPVQIIGTPLVKVDGRVKADATIIGQPSVDVASVSGGKAILPVQVINQSVPVEVTNQMGAQASDKPIDVNLVGLQGDLPVRITNMPIRVDFDPNAPPMSVLVRNDFNTCLPVAIFGVPRPWPVEVTNFPAKQ